MLKRTQISLLCSFFFCYAAINAQNTLSNSTASPVFSHATALIEKAESLLEYNLCFEAKQLFLKVYQHNNSTDFQKALCAFRLAEISYLDDCYELSLKWLNSFPKDLESLENPLLIKELLYKKHFLLGKCYQKLNLFQQAEKSFSKCLEIYPNKEKALLEKNKMIKEKSAFSSSSKTLTNPLKKKYLDAISRLKKNDLNSTFQAISLLEELPQNRYIRLYLAYAYFLYGTQSNNSSFFQKSQSLAKDLVAQEIEAPFCLNLIGFCALHQKKLKQAIDAFLQSFETKNTLFTYRLLLKSLLLQGAYSQAEVYLNRYPQYLKDHEVLYLKSLLCLKQKRKKQAILLLKEIASRQSDYSDYSLYLLGVLEDKRFFKTLIDCHPFSPLTGNAKFWIAKATNDQHLLEDVYQNHEDASLADEAYFFRYSFDDYLSDNPKAYLHLQKMEEKFPSSPYLLTAYYLMALKNQTDDEEKLLYSIYLFEQIEKLFPSLSFNEEQLAYYSDLKKQAMLEKANCYLKIASLYHGAKKKLYVEYAANVYRSLMSSDLSDLASLGVAKCFVLNKNYSKAKKIFSSIIEQKKKEKIIKGDLIAKVWYEQAKIAMEEKRYKQAIFFFDRAKEAVDESIWTNDQILDLTIQKSLCYKELNMLDQAMLLLSEVINKDVISSQRVKAMYLRSFIYEKQKRYELALKQLIATSTKGGKWANLAKKRLKENYGYD